MRRLLAALCLLSIGCQAQKPYAGTYISASGSEIILNSDGTYRYMIGERTGSQDPTGTFTVDGDRFSFAGVKSKFTSATLQGDILKTDSGAFTKK